MKRSETVGQSSVNRLVAGLNLARGANKIRQFLRSSKPQISKADLCIAKSQVRQGPSGPIHQNIVGQSLFNRRPSKTVRTDCTHGESLSRSSIFLYPKADHALRLSHGPACPSASIAQDRNSVND